MQLKKAPLGLWNKQSYLIEQNIGQSMQIKNEYNQTFNIKLKRLICRTNTATNRGSHLIFHWFHLFCKYIGKKRLLCIGCDVVVISTTNSCDLDLCSPFHFMSIRSIKVMRKVLCFRKNTFMTVFKQNKVYLHDNAHTLHACHNGFNVYHCIP